MTGSHSEIINYSDAIDKLDALLVLKWAEEYVKDQKILVNLCKCLDRYKVNLLPSNLDSWTIDELDEATKTTTYQVIKGILDPYTDKALFALAADKAENSFSFVLGLNKYYMVEKAICYLEANKKDHYLLEGIYESSIFRNKEFEIATGVITVDSTGVNRSKRENGNAYVITVLEVPSLKKENSDSDNNYVGFCYLIAFVKNTVDRFKELLHYYNEYSSEIEAFIATAGEFPPKAAPTRWILPAMNGGTNVYVSNF